MLSQSYAFHRKSFVINASRAFGRCVMTNWKGFNYLKQAVSVWRFLLCIVNFREQYIWTFSIPTILFQKSQFLSYNVTAKNDQQSMP